MLFFGKEDSVFRDRNDDILYPNAITRAFRERDVPFLKFLALLPEPSLRDEFLRLGEKDGVFMDCSVADGYSRLESDVISA